jgi:holo-[acyl-carrier protein] synthase
MILGVGVDLIDIRRIERTLARFGARFTARCFNELERAKADRRRTRAATYAKRFAAKEACSKALGTGFDQGVFMRDIGVVNLPSGQPTLALTGGAARRLDAMTPAGHVAELHLTLTDEPPLAQALVFITVRPAS